MLSWADPNSAQVLRYASTVMHVRRTATHFCIGAALGRQMLNAGLAEVYRQFPDIGLAGEPVLQQNNFMNGVFALPVRWSPPES
ncbi:MAG: hypothetical protein M3Y91_13545 [Actinomycetota bacterium]|nr:hypothetical protein [Actinomycetota bacterium]